jgi:hypothetical protein
MGIMVIFPSGKATDVVKISVDYVKYKWSCNSTPLYVFRTYIEESLLFLPNDCYFNQLKSFDFCNQNTSYRNVKNFFHRQQPLDNKPA